MKEDVTTALLGRCTQQSVLIAEKRQKCHSSLKRGVQSIVESATRSIGDISPNQTRVDYAYLVRVFSIFFLYCLYCLSLPFFSVSIVILNLPFSQ